MKTSTIGVLGDGQLAQMTCLAGQTLGCVMHVYAQSPDSPAAKVADRVWLGDLNDEKQLARFAEAVDVITYDTELLPVACVRSLQTHARLCPSPELLYIAQNRIRERAFLRQIDIPMPQVAPVLSAEDAYAAALSMGVPGILKTAEQGYDGKGQVRVDRPDEARPAWQALGGVPCVLEERVSFVAEMSVLVAGSLDGTYQAYPVVDNRHEHHILHLSSAPSQLPQAAQDEATRIALAIAKAAQLVGLLAVEMFYTQGGRVLVNELAPRPHNSGHHTQVTTATSQFLQLCRAITGLALGPLDAQPGAMVNLLGELFIHLDPQTDDLIYQHAGFLSTERLVNYLRTYVQEQGEWSVDLERCHVYFYGKEMARPGRKMGHAMIVDDTVQGAVKQMEALHALFAAAEQARERKV